MKQQGVVPLWMVLWSIAGYSANPQVSLTAHGTDAYYWDDALVEESAKKMTPAKFQSKVQLYKGRITLSNR